MWYALTGGHVFTYHGHTSGVNAVAWSPNGKHIASASFDGTVQVWDATTGRNVYTYTGQDSNAVDNLVNAVAWSPDGKLIASGGEDQKVQVWQPG